MASDAARVEALLARGRFKRPEAVALGLAALAVSLGAAAWISDTDQASFAAAALPTGPSLSSFNDRFSPMSAPSVGASMPSVGASAPNVGASAPAADRFASATLELRLQDARSQLGRQLTTSDWRASLVDGAAPAAVAPPSTWAGLPMPRPRPRWPHHQAPRAPTRHGPPAHRPPP